MVEKYFLDSNGRPNDDFAKEVPGIRQSVAISDAPKVSSLPNLLM